ncbi:FAD-dependent oxidoreductase [Verticiella sediminum]|uniref:FAD-dependent oxidoreductase n=1 Tax=Verticiella sediminum TaxID=1247510 RepID=A0A556AIM0_9BURK|nr:FAD-dependent oxidoreductase [Verticiella sediminum]TSH92752.1 FAD-dependent oxidoreductase [Verticiella sediminum]
MQLPARQTSRITTDVIVVGGGGSGLAAAIEAAAVGRRVMLVEKGPRLGGTTAWSVGSISATNTPQQLRRGILDSPDAHLEDLEKFNSVLGLKGNAALSRTLVDNVPETVRWLMSMGVEFFGPMNELPHRKPRMHLVLPNSRAYIYHLSHRARTLGVDIRTSTRAIALLTEHGAVLGIRCDTPDGALEILARGGVVLCSGDYSASQHKRAEHLGLGMADVQPVNIRNTGDGHDMVQQVGGRLINSHLFLAGIRFEAPSAKWLHRLPPWRIVTRAMRFMLEALPGALIRPLVMSFLTTVLVPSPKLLRQGAILVNGNGLRFCDELDSPGPCIAQQPGQVAYLILDAKLAARFTGWPNYVSTAPGLAYASIADYRSNRKDIYREAPSLDALAKKIGVPAEALARTVAEHNRNMGTNAETDSRRALDEGPYIALGPVRYLINFTDGGVAVSDNLEVLGADGQGIPGLYAAGFTGMGGVLLEGHGHHLAWAFTSGRLAGRRAAYRAVTDDIPEAAHAAAPSH